MKYKYAYVDSSTASFVVACKECGGAWSTIRFDPVSALRAKADHDQRVHQVEPARAAHAEAEHQKRSGVSQSIE
jgi:hypothetical protein